MGVDPSNPLALLLAGTVAMSSVVVFVWKDGQRRTDQLLAEKDSVIAWLKHDLEIARQQTTAWQDAAFKGTQIAEVAVRQTPARDR